MGQRKCMVANCYETDPLSKYRTHHKFPKNKEAREKWMQVMGISIVKSNFVICDRHFTSADYGCSFLTKNAIPSRDLVLPKPKPKPTRENIVIEVSAGDSLGSYGEAEDGYCIEEIGGLGADNESIYSNIDQEEDYEHNIVEFLDDETEVEYEQAPVPDSDSKINSDYVLFFLVKSTDGNWTCPLEYHTFGGSINETDMKLIEFCYKIGLKVKVLPSDPRMTMNKLKVAIEKPYFFWNNMEVYAILEQYNLLKNVRNVFLNKKVDFQINMDFDESEESIELIEMDDSESEPE